MNLTEIAEKEFKKIYWNGFNKSLCPLRALRDKSFGCGTAALWSPWLKIYLNEVRALRAMTIR